MLGYIQNNNLFPEPLSAEEEKYYLDKFMEGDEDARNILIERNLRLVAHICKKYNIPNIEQDDLISIGTIGFIKGINTFKPDKNVKLATYASRCIENEILMFLRSNKKLGAEVYLNEPIGKDKDNNEITLIDVLENDEKSIEEEIDFKLKLRNTYQKIKEVLKEKEQIVINLRFGLGGKKPKTQNEVAEIMGISRSYVSRIEKKAISKLTNEISKQ
jgi:RNA polymerase sporulation-specific sigma factor